MHICSCIYENIFDIPIGQSSNEMYIEMFKKQDVP